MARNFAIVYLEQAVARAPPADRFAEASWLCVPQLPTHPACIILLLTCRPTPGLLQLPALLNGISSCPQQHQDMLLRMAAQV